MEELLSEEQLTGISLQARDEIFEGIYTDGWDVIKTVNKEGLFTALPHIREYKGGMRRNWQMVGSKEAEEKCFFTWYIVL